MSAVSVLFMSVIVTASSFNWNRPLAWNNPPQSPEPLKEVLGYEPESEAAPIYPPLYRANVKTLLSQALVRPKILPRLKFGKTFPARKGGSKLSSLVQKFKLPKLLSTPLKLSESQSNNPKVANQRPEGEASKSMNIAVPSMLAEGELPLKMKQSKPTWLMGIGDLRSETCRAAKYNRTITSKGCKPLVIESKFCSGRCNSFFVPSQKADFQSCSSCFPTDYNIVMLMLECPDRKRGYKMKQIPVIKDCKCQSVMECSN